MQDYQCLVLCCCTIIMSTVVAATTPSCGELGFKETLLCSRCNDLAQFVPNEDLIKDCRRCCAEESATMQTHYSSATLTICQCKLHRFPHINEFIQKEASNFPALTIDYANAADPVFELKDSNGNVELLSIDNWKTEQIIEFLQEKLS